MVTRPKKTDSLEAYIGEEFLGVLFVENEKGRRSYIFELPILDVDLDGGPVVDASRRRHRPEARDQPVDAVGDRRANRRARRAESAP